jgi:PAS domain S-box-containing protein
MKNTIRLRSNIAALKTIIIYMLFGGVWIFFSDSLLNRVVKNQETFYLLSTVKGWAYVLITALILYFLIKKYAKTIQSSMLEIDSLINHLNNLTKYANDIILLMNEDGQIIDANDRALETYDYSKKEMLELNSNDLCLVNEKNLLNRLVLDSSDKNSEIFETLQVKKNGEKFFAEVRTRIIEVGEKHYYQSIIKNITEIKEAEKSILESKLDYQELADLLPQVVFEADLNGVLTFGNRTGHEMFGLTQDGLNNNLKIFDFILPDDHLKARINFKRLIETGKTAGDQYLAVRRDGSKFPCMIFSNLIIKEGKPVGARGLLIDISEQKRIENELRKSEERYRLLIESLPVAVALYSEGKIIFVNPAAVSLVRAKNKEELIGQNVLNFVHPDYRETALKRMESMLTSGISQSLIEEKFIRLDGSVLDVETSAAPIYYQGKLAIQVAVNDITWRKIAENALKDSEEKYRTLVEMANDAIIIAEVDTGIIIDANLKAEKLTGKTKSELIGLHQSQLHPPEEVERYSDHFKRDSNDSKYYLEDIYIHHSSGRLIPVEISHSVCVLGNKKVMQGIFRDITERKQAEEQIRILSQAVEQSPISIVITDIKGNIEYVNLKFTRLTGYTLTEVLGKNPRILKSGMNSNRIYKQLWETIISGREWQGELHNRKKDGTFYWELASISPIRDSRNNIIHFLAVKEDITAKKIMTEELILAKEKAEESDHLKSEFLAQMSHEIRTPLNIILSYNYLLREQLDENSETDYSTIFNSIDSASKRLLRTIDLILNMSAIQTGKLKANLSKIDLHSILKKLIIEFGSTAESRNIKLSFKSELFTSVIKTDEHLVIEIFQNLIDNALKYTNEGNVEITVYKNLNDQISVDISDTGIGITKEYLPKLFQPFTQEQTGYSRRYEGNGLGLALVKKYLDMINSTIIVQSEKDKGTTFTIIFKNWEL